MSIDVNMDYTTLFSSLSTSSSSSSSSSSTVSLADYASLQNGSYLKLAKAYYAKNSATDSTSSEDTAKTITSIQSDSNSLKDAANALVTTGSNSLFNKTDVTSTNSSGASTTTKGYDMDAIYKGVKKFVDSYNDLISSGADSENNSILRQTLNLTNETSTNSNLLSNVGITIGSDNTLSVDEAALKKANVNTLKTLFNGTGSYAYDVAAKASMINYAAGTEASKAGTYSSSGTYSTGSSGSLYDSYF